MRVVTYATHDAGFLKYLVLSAKRHHVQLDIIGWNTNWNGFGDKYRGMNLYLQSVPDDDVVLFIDAYDVLLLRSLDGLEIEYRQKFFERKPKIVLSVAPSHRLTDQWYRVFFDQCRNVNVNTGTYIGYAGLIKKVLISICQQENCHDKNFDDQRSLTSFCNQHDDMFEFDEQQKWFLNFGLLEYWTLPPFQVIDKQVVYKGNRPYVLHCPGNLDMTPYILLLGYLINQETPQRSHFRYFFNIIENHCTHLITEYMSQIIIVIIVTLIFFRSFRPGA